MRDKGLFYRKMLSVLIVQTMLIGAFAFLLSYEVEAVEELERFYEYYVEEPGKNADWDADGLWHIVDDSDSYPCPDGGAYSPTHSWWFGNDNTGNFISIDSEGNSTRSWGSLTNDNIDLHYIAGTPVLKFRYWMDTEGIEGVDTLAVYSKLASSTSWTHHDLDPYTGGLQDLYRDTTGWAILSISLPWSYIDTNISLRFTFDSKDGIDNDGRGVYIDDIIIFSVKKDLAVSSIVVEGGFTDSFASVGTPVTIVTYIKNIGTMDMPEGETFEIHCRVLNRIGQYEFPTFHQVLPGSRLQAGKSQRFEFSWSTDLPDKYRVVIEIDYEQDGNQGNNRNYIYFTMGTHYFYDGMEDYERGSDGSDGGWTVSGPGDTFYISDKYLGPPSDALENSASGRKFFRAGPPAGYFLATGSYVLESPEIVIPPSDYDYVWLDFKTTNQISVYTGTLVIFYAPASLTLTVDGEDFDLYSWRDYNAEADTDNYNFMSYNLTNYLDDRSVPHTVQVTFTMPGVQRLGTTYFGEWFLDDFIVYGYNEVYDHTMTVEPDSAIVRLGSTFVYPVKVRNMGNELTSFNVSWQASSTEITDHDWDVYLESPGVDFLHVSLYPNEQGELSLYVTPGVTTPLGGPYDITVKAISQETLIELTHTTSTIVVSDQELNLTFEGGGYSANKDTALGAPVEFNFTVFHGNTTTIEANLNVVGVPELWDYNLTIGGVEMESGEDFQIGYFETIPVTLTVTPYPEALPASPAAVISIYAEKSIGQVPSNTLNATVDIVPMKKVEIETYQTSDFAEENMKVYYELTIWNRGNVPDIITVDVDETSLPDHPDEDKDYWDYSLSPTSQATVEPFNHFMTTLSIHIPLGTETGTYPVNVSAISSTPSVSDDITLLIHVVQLHDIVIVPESGMKSVPVGENRTHSVDVSNEGVDKAIIDLEVEQYGDDPAYQWIELNRTQTGYINESDGAVAIGANIMLNDVNASEAEAGTHTFVFSGTIDRSSLGLEDQKRSVNISFDIPRKAGVDVQVPDEQLEVSVGPGGSLVYDVTVYNIGNFDDTFHFDLVTNSGTVGWTATHPETASVGRGGSTTIQMTLNIPADTDADDGYTVSFKATSQYAGSVSDSVVLTVDIEEIYEVDITATNYSLSLAPGASGKYNIRVYNNGNVEDTILLSIEGENDEWLEISHSSLDVDSGSVASTTIDVDPVSNARAGTYHFNVVATSWGDNSATSNITVSLTITKVYGASTFILDEADRNPVIERGDSVYIDLTIQNSGNTEDDMTIDVTGEHPTWFEYPSSVHISPYSSTTEQISINVPKDADPGEYIFVITVTPKNGLGTATTETIKVTVEGKEYLVPPIPLTLGDYFIIGAVLVVLIIVIALAGKPKSPKASSPPQSAPPKPPTGDIGTKI